MSLSPQKKLDFALTSGVRSRRKKKVLFLPDFLNKNSDEVLNSKKYLEFPKHRNI